MVHELKILPIYLDAILEGKKTFEIRFNDRNFQTGDILKFVCNGYVPFYFQVTYILQNVSQFGLMDGFCIMSIKPFKEY